jgi:proline dehydrogenase
MGLARSALLAASRSTWLAGQMTRRSFAQRAVRRFMPGETLEAALDAAGPLAAQGIAGVITKLGENLTALADADAVREHYLGAIAEITRRKLDCSPSVKPTQLGLDHSAEACLANLGALAAAAKTAGLVFWVDMEDSRYVDRTLDLYRALQPRYGNVGLCLQAYLRRTPADFESLLPLKPAIRWVKGAYAEPPEVAFSSKRDTDAAYERLARRHLTLTRDGAGLCVLGTHDVPLVRRLAAHAAAAGAKDGADLEVHMLFGIRAAEQTSLTREGRKVRTLIAYGSHWFPWYMRRLAERPANVWFVVKSLAG